MPQLFLNFVLPAAIVLRPARHTQNEFGTTASKQKKLINDKQAVYVSLAPSWISDFENISPAKIITTLKQLGFSGVSETALGAQAVSASVSAILKDHKNGALISSACPVVVDYIRKYQDKFVPGNQ